MKIYKFYDGEVVEVEARETKRTYVLSDRISAFRCFKTILKKDACETAEQAIYEEINRCITLISMHQEKLDEAKKRLEYVTKHEHPYF